MSRSKRYLVLAFLAILAPGSAHTQSPATVPGLPSTGTLTGFVYDGDMRVPIRFAEIHLVPMPPNADASSTGDQATTLAVPQQRERRVQSVVGTSGMDGSFRLNVPEGGYLVAASKPGYVNPGTAAAKDFTLSEDQLRGMIASLPQVHVGAGQTSSVNLTIHRGAAIVGRIRFADGSPAVGAMVECDLSDSLQRMESLMRPENRGKVASALQQALQSLAISQNTPQRLTTDDQGRFRIFGLSPGKYLVGTSMFLDSSGGRIAMNDGSQPYASGWQEPYPEMIAVYAPATFRRKDATVFEIHGNEQVTDADLTIDPSGLHTLKGRVLAAGDNHAPRTMMQVREEGAKEVPRTIMSEEDGTFQVNYLPSGRYTLRIISSSDAPTTSTVEPLQYKAVDLPAVVVDHDVVLDDVLLVPLKPGEHNTVSFF